MKKNKLIKISILFSILILLIVALSSHFTVKANYGGASDLLTFTKYGWDDVKDLKFSSDTLLATNGHNGDTDNGNYAIGYPNSNCFHAESFNVEGGSVKLKAIIDIDPDGKITIHDSTGDHSYDDSVSGAKILAAYAQKVTGIGIKRWI